MKRLVYISIMTLFMSVNSSLLTAQGLYLELNGGYGTGFGTANFSMFQNTHYENETVTYEMADIFLGSGINFGGSIGYMFNGNIGIDLSFSMLRGMENSITSKSIYQWGDYQDKTSLSSNMFRFAPSLVLMADLIKVNPYAKFGVIAGFGTIRNDSRATSGDPENDLIINSEFSGGNAIGISASLGAVYPVSERFSIFGEFRMINKSYAPTKAKILKYMDEGVDQLPHLSKNEKEINFVDKITYDYNMNPDPDKPGESLRIEFPFSSFGVNFGLRIGL